MKPYYLMRATQGRRVVFALPESLTAEQLEEFRKVAKKRAGWCVGTLDQRVKREVDETAREAEGLSDVELTLKRATLVDECALLLERRGELVREVKREQARAKLLRSKRESLTDYASSIVETVWDRLGV